MALDKDRLGSAVAAVIQSAAPAPGATLTAGDLETLWQSIADEFIKEFKNNGVVSTTVTTPDTINGTGTGTIA